MPKRPPIPSAHPLLKKALALRIVCSVVGGTLFQATVLHELFPVPLPMAHENALSPYVAPFWRQIFHTISKTKLAS
jgi:hypothetical protein